jgi:glutaredoxin
MKQSLILYHFEECPYCQKVSRFINQNQLTIATKNIHKDPLAKEELLRISGKTQVPCLLIDGEPLFESDDIITWLTANQVA